MLSISARGSAESAAAYYESLADTELEDYYSQEAAGVYLGSGAKSMGLVGQVERDEFLELSAGKTPFGEVQGAGTKHRTGWDATASAPKSVSVLWATANEPLQAAIQAAHDHAVVEMVRFIEDHASFTRRGSGSESDEARHQKVGLVIAAYRHGTSREQDPQLHTHCMVFNAAPRADGTVGALDSHPLYQWKMAAGAVYRSELARGLRELGFELERDGTSFAVKGVSAALTDEFSTRRKQIEAAMEKRGVAGAKAAEIATLDTRKAKEAVTREDLRQSWKQRAQERAPGWEPSRLLKPERDLAPAPEFDVPRIQEQMTQQHSTLGEAQLYATVAVDQQISGGREHIERSTGAVKDDLQTVQLQSKHQVRYTTQEMQKLEQSMVDQAVALSRVHSHPVSQQSLDAALKARPTLSDEQKEAVRHITQSGDLACIQGTAGSGKSFALGAARDAWQAEGYQVRGASLSGKAAQELEKGSGISSTTLKRLEMDTRGWVDEHGEFHEPVAKFTAKDVLVVDEAGMSGSRQEEALLKDVKKSGAKVVLVGDTRQLQAIEAGAAFRAIQERIGAAKIDTIQRQYDPADRQVVRDLQEGRADAAIASLAARGRIHEFDNVFEAKQAIGHAVVQDLAAGKVSLGLTITRAEARDINEHAHQVARELGKLHGADVDISTPYGSRQITAGDRLIFMRNSTKLDVKNGHIGTVRAIESEGHRRVITVELDVGGIRHVDTSRYDHVEYGYAITVAKSQGSSPDRTHSLVGDGGLTSRELATVTNSRAREATHVYGDSATLRELAPAWSKARQKDLTLDYEISRK